LLSDAAEKLATWNAKVTPKHSLIRFDFMRVLLEMIFALILDLIRE
jgi:hypothetical protein